MSMLKVIEVLAESSQGWEDAAKQAVANAAKTVRNIKSIYVENFEATVDGEQITHYRVNAKNFFPSGATALNFAGVPASPAAFWYQPPAKALSPAAPDHFSGVAEADEKFFLRSFKGHRGWKRGQPPEPRPPRYRGSGALLPGLSWQQVPVLTCIDRNNHHLDEVLEKRTKAEVLNRLEKLIEPGTVLCSDDFQGYAALAGKVGAEHRIIERSQDTWLKKAIGHAPPPKGRTRAWAGQLPSSGDGNARQPDASGEYRPSICPPISPCCASSAIRLQNSH